MPDRPVHPTPCHPRWTRRQAGHALLVLTAGAAAWPATTLAAPDAQAGHIGLCGFNRLARYQLASDQILLPLQVTPGLGQLCTDLVHLRLGMGHLCAGLGQGCLLFGVDQTRQHLPCFDMLALLDQHLGQRAGDLGGNRRLAPRRDITGRLQHGGGRIGIGAGRHRGNRGDDKDGTRGQPPPDPGPAQPGNHHQRQDPRQARGRLGLIAVDSQLVEQFTLVFHYCLSGVAWSRTV